MPIGLDDAQEEADKTILESRDDALCCSDSGGLRLLFQAPYLSVGTAGLSTVCESNIGRGPFRYLNGGSEYHPQIIWQWKKLPLLQSSIGSKEWLREQHLHVAVESDGVCIGEAQVPLLKTDDIETTNVVTEKEEAKEEKDDDHDNNDVGTEVITETLTLERNSAGRLGIRFDDYLRIHAASSWSKKFGIKEGHRILKCQNQRVSNIKDLMKVLPKTGTFTVEVLYQGIPDSVKRKKQQQKNEGIETSDSIEKFSRGEIDNKTVKAPKLKKKNSMVSTTPSLTDTRTSDTNYTERVVPVYQKGRVVGLLIVRFDVVSNPSYTNVLGLGVLDPLLDETEWAIERVRGMDVCPSNPSLTNSTTKHEERNRSQSVSQTILNKSEKVIRKMRRKSSKLLDGFSGSKDNVKELQEENAALKRKIQDLETELERAKHNIETLKLEMRSVRKKAGKVGGGSAIGLPGLRRFESFQKVLEMEAPQSPTHAE